MLICSAARSLRSCRVAGSRYVEISPCIGSSLRASGRECNNDHARHQHSQHSQEIIHPQSNDLTVLDGYKATLSFPAATHAIRDLANVECSTGEVILHGYLGTRHDLSKKLSFVSLLSNDLKHSIQLVSGTKAATGKTPTVHEQLKACGPNSPVVVKGLLRHRNPPPNKGPVEVIKVGNRELDLLDIQCLNEFPKDIICTAETVFPLEQRHLQIRQEKRLRDAMAFRAAAASRCRKILEDLDFQEVETPLLFKSTPEGAREFIVPTRQKGLAYALPQSPQQFKQILMASGISRYYQMARCFRDEDMRADRQPEFTQLDLEISFATGEDVMQCIETLVKDLWKAMLPDSPLPSTFPRMTYEHAMGDYGSDKPDSRLGMKINRFEHLLPVDLISKISPLNQPIVDVMRLPLGQAFHDPDVSRKFISNFLDSAEAQVFVDNPDGGPGVFIYDSSKPLAGLQAFGFEAAEEVERLYDDIKDGDIVILQARTNAAFHGGSTPLGNLRLALHHKAVEQSLTSTPDTFEPLWVTDFPLFSPSISSEPGQGGSAGLASTHHPFTSPKSARDVELLLTDPTRAIGDHYDLVVNGVELGGGSRRIHNAAVQRFVLESVLRMDTSRVAEFAHLFEVLRAGCPPHAGIALGLDRLVAVMLGRESVRDVIAFPKGKRGEDLLVRSPGAMSEEVLRTYHLRVREVE